MVTLTVTSGPYKGRLYPVTPLSIKDYLHIAVKEGWHWEIDYSQATEEENFNIFKCELTVRIIRALLERRRVTFLVSTSEYYTWKVETEDQVDAFAAIIEDVLVNSGRTITINQDEKELIIIAVGYEQ